MNGSSSEGRYSALVESLASMKSSFRAAGP